MARPLFTGSSVERARLCPASQAFAHAKTTSEDAERGKAIHAFLAAVGKLGLTGALATVPDAWRAACEAIRLDMLPQIDAAGYAAEVSFAYDVELGTARELGRDLDRNYGPLAPNEVPLTVDSVALCSDGEGVGVWDYKSGQGRVTRADRNPQLLIGALAAARAYGRTRAEVGIIYVREGADPWVDRASIDEWSLDAFAADLRTIASAVRHARQLHEVGIIPDTHAGDHCKFCPAYVHCPATTALARSLATDAAAVRHDIEVALTPELARLAYDKWRRAKDMINRAGDALIDYVKANGPIELDGGTVFGPVTTTKEYVMGDRAWNVLVERHGMAAATKACTVETSKEAIRRALREVVPVGGVASAEREILDALRKVGGVERKTTITVKEHTPRRKGLEAGNDD